MKDKITICRAEPFHINRIYAIEQNCFNVPWSKELLLDEIKQKDSIVLCAYYSGNMAGFCSLKNICGEGHITNIAVEDKYRRRGIGTALAERLIAEAHINGMKNITLEVRTSNVSAISLYEKFGFICVGIRKGYYLDNNEDALIMWKYDQTPDEKV